MGWKEIAAGLGTRTTARAIEAARGKVSKRQYKRLISTAVAQLLELHPDIGRKQAIKRARRITGAKPSKRLLRAAENFGVREGAQAAVAAVATAGIAKVAGILGDKLRERLGDGHDSEDGAARERSGAEETSAPRQTEETMAHGRAVSEDDLEGS